MRSGRLRSGLEKDVLDSIPVDTTALIDGPMRTRLFHEVLIYIGSNSRQLELYTILKEHAARTALQLQEKC
jgi:hypothetical protein